MAIKLFMESLMAYENETDVKGVVGDIDLMSDLESRMLFSECLIGMGDIDSMLLEGAAELDEKYNGDEELIMEALVKEGGLLHKAFLSFVKVTMNIQLTHFSQIMALNRTTDILLKRMIKNAKVIVNHPKYESFKKDLTWDNVKFRISTKNRIISRSVDVMLALAKTDYTNIKIIAGKSVMEIGSVGTDLDIKSMKAILSAYDRATTPKDIIYTLIVAGGKNDPDVAKLIPANSKNVAGEFYANMWALGDYKLVEGDDVKDYIVNTLAPTYEKMAGQDYEEYNKSIDKLYASSSIAYQNIRKSLKEAKAVVEDKLTPEDMAVFKEYTKVAKRILNDFTNAIYIIHGLIGSCGDGAIGLADIGRFKKILNAGESTKSVTIDDDKGIMDKMMKRLK